jgi:hypothetical protein
MSTFNCTPATDLSKGNNFSCPLDASEAESIAHIGPPDSTIDFGSSPRFPGDPAAIARGIFRDEISDVLVVLKNCGALNTAAERRWCVEELTRLLDSLGL